MIHKLSILILFTIVLLSCTKSINENNPQKIVQYNLIKPGTDIYLVTDKNVDKALTQGKNHEKVYLDGSKIIKIERYDSNGKLTDEFDVSAVTDFEYDSDGNVKYVKYFDKNGNKWEDDVFGYWSIEYIYDENGKVRMEIYRDKDSKFLKVPRDNSGNIAKINFLAPVLTYEYIEGKLRIKALDQNFNLLKEVVGDKPCIPFIDCGESD